MECDIKVAYIQRATGCFDSWVSATVCSNHYTHRQGHTTHRHITTTTVRNMGPVQCNKWINMNNDKSMNHCSYVTSIVQWYRRDSLNTEGSKRNGYNSYFSNSLAYLGLYSPAMFLVPPISIDLHGYTRSFDFNSRGTSNKR